MVGAASYIFLSLLLSSPSLPSSLHLGIHVTVIDRKTIDLPLPKISSVKCFKEDLAVELTQNLGG